MALALPWIVGAALALGIFVLGRVAGMDRERAYDSTILIAVALCYELFAVLGRSTSAMIGECLIFCVFLALAVLGFRRNLWIVAVGLTAHGVMDLFHGRLVANPGVPPWWPPFCSSFDVVAGVCLAWLLQRSALRAKPV